MRLNLFSLIELVVIIAVLVGLISLLQPSLKNILQNSEDLHCKNNLRNIYQPIVLYTEENGGYLPGPVWYGQKAWVLKTKWGRNWLSEYLVDYFPEKLLRKDGFEYNPYFVCPTNAKYELEVPFYARVIYRAIFIENYGRPFGRRNKKDLQRPMQLSDLPLDRGFLLQDADNVNYPHKPTEMPPFPVHSNLTRNTLFADGAIEAIDKNLVVVDPL